MQENGPTTLQQQEYELTKREKKEKSYNTILYSRQKENRYELRGI